MSDNNRFSETKADDLNLIILFERVISFFRRYAILIAIFSATGMSTGYILFKTSHKIYSSTLLLHPFLLTNTEHIATIDNWNELLKNEEYDALSERFNCDTGMLKKVKKITASEIQKLYIPNNPNGFIVDVLVSDNGVLDSLQRGIIYGLENSDYMKARLFSRRSTLTQLIDKVTSELAKLDSTKRNIENNINNNNRHPSSFIIDVSNINAQMISLNEKLLDYQDQLRFSSVVQVLHKFEKFRKPASPKLFKLLILGFIAGFAIGYIVSVCLYLRKRLKTRSKVSSRS